MSPFVSATGSQRAFRYRRILRAHGGRHCDLLESCHHTNLRHRRLRAYCSFLSSESANSAVLVAGTEKWLLREHPPRAARSGFAVLSIQRDGTYGWHPACERTIVVSDPSVATHSELIVRALLSGTRRLPAG
jgi:hypothetical protein